MMDVRISTPVGVMYVEDCHSNNESGVIKIFDSNHKYLDEYSTRYFYSAFSSSDTAEQAIREWWKNFCLGLNCSSNINEIFDFLTTPTDIISKDEIEIAEYLCLAYEKYNDVKIVLDEADCVNKIGDYYIVVDRGLRW